MTQLLREERIALRPFEPEDAAGLLAYLNDPGLAGCRYVPDDRPDVLLTISEVRGILEKWSQTRRRLHLAVTSAENGNLLGHTAAYWGWDAHCPDVEVVIAPAFQRQGLGSAALALVLNWVFNNLPAHNVSGFMADWNAGAQAFSAAHGFKPAGASRRESIWRGAFVDEVVMDILRPEWEARDGS